MKFWLPIAYLMTALPCNHDLFKKMRISLIIDNPYHTKTINQNHHQIHLSFIKIWVSKSDTDNVATIAYYWRLQYHHPFHPGIPSRCTVPPESQSLAHPRQLYTNHLSPYGTPMPSIDHTKILRVCMINTQHMFHLYGDNIDMHTAIANLKTLSAQMFVPISPNINWCNCSNWIQTKQIFQEISPHNHLCYIQWYRKGKRLLHYLFGWWLCHPDFWTLVLQGMQFWIRRKWLWLAMVLTP